MPEDLAEYVGFIAAQSAYRIDEPIENSRRDLRILGVSKPETQDRLLAHVDSAKVQMREARAGQVGLSAPEKNASL